MSKEYFHSFLGKIKTVEELINGPVLLEYTAGPRVQLLCTVASEFSTVSGSATAVYTAVDLRK